MIVTIILSRLMNILFLPNCYEIRREEKERKLRRLYARYEKAKKDYLANPNDEKARTKYGELCTRHNLPFVRPDETLEKKCLDK